MKAFRITLSMAAFTGLLAAHAFAQDNASGRSPEDINQEIIENAKVAPDGTVQPETGRAEPVENWFGCKPGNDKPECEADSRQEKSAASGAPEPTENAEKAPDGSAGSGVINSGAARRPQDVNQEIIENATTAPDGTVQPETGRANPVENWFGCKPDNDKPECKADNSQEKSGAASSEDETASKRVQ